jgi:hypothetical protein
MEVTSRETLPKASDRLKLGASGLSVSPICLGIAGSADTVVAAFDAGINFFFISGDLHWPRYEGLRRGLEELLSRRPSVRDEIVVGVVSYLEEPLFHYLQFDEVIESIPGLKRVDLLIAGAVSSAESFKTRLFPLREARLAGHHGSRAIGATFHHRACALLSLNHDCLDIHYVRYNTAHRRAVEDFFPHVRSERTALIFSFKSTFPVVAEERFRQLGLDDGSWLPKVTDYYRFALTHRHLDGILCRLSCPREVEELVAALDEKPLTTDELAYLVGLTSGSITKMPDMP